jgi:alpha-mannosidase
MAATASVTPVLSGTVPVDLASVYNVAGIYDDGATFAPSASLDGDGFALSGQLLGREQVGSGVVFEVGPANAPDAVMGKIVTLPQGKFDSLKILAVGINGNQELQTFTVTYADGTSSTFTQSLSDWALPQSFTGESVAVTMPYRITAEGSKDGRNFYLFAYSFGLDSNKVVRSLSLPMNREALVFAATLVPISKPSP